MQNVFGLFGRTVISPLVYFFELLVRTYLVLKSFIVESRNGKRLPVRTISWQVYFTGIEALPIISLVGLALGVAVIVELAIILPAFGAGKYVERLAIIVLVRELIPIITALIIIGRSGTAIATELGTIRLNREIELLDSLGINIDYFIFLPRLVGMMVATICLTIVFNTVALGGGFLLAKIFAPAGHGLIFSNLLAAINIDDVVMSLLKALVFGWAIACVNCLAGLSVQRSITEVPQVATRGVVNSIIICFLCSIFISLYVFPSFNI